MVSIISQLFFILLSNHDNLEEPEVGLKYTIDRLTTTAIRQEGLFGEFSKLSF